MRISLGVGLMAVCLSLTGCSLFGKKSSGPATAAAPFPGNAPATERAANDSTAPPGGINVNGILAGQVLDTFNRRRPAASIQIVDLQDTRQPASARIEMTPDKNDGYFTIVGLIPGHHYQLIARVQEGGKVLSGTTLAMPPNPRLSIYISEDYTNSTTPPVPGPPTIPGKSDNKPAATLEPPVKAREADPPAPGNEKGTSQGASTTSPTPPVNPANIADTRDTSAPEPGGFQRVPPAPRVEIPTVPKLPPPPEVKPRSQEAVPSDPAHEGALQTPAGPTPVPSCVLVGKKLDNFALSRLDGQPWEFRRDHKGRLVLLDFWHSSCGPCLQAVPRLVELQREYGPYGLEVVGIAYETGKVEDQVRKVYGVRGRYTINYLTLLGGGGSNPCPVQSQFQVSNYPTLVLLDDGGQILWRREGLDENHLYELKQEISRRLGVRSEE